MEQYYAVVSEGVVKNIIVWDAEEQPDWTPAEGKAVLIKEGVDVGIGYTYVKNKFTPPPVPPKSQAEIEHENLVEYNSRYAEATRYITVLTDATDPEIMGEDIDAADVDLLKAWKKYRVELTRVDRTIEAPTWPVRPA